MGHMLEMRGLTCYTGVLNPWWGAQCPSLPSAPPMLRVAKEDVTYAEPWDSIIFSEVVSWHVMLSPPDLVAASIERDDFQTGSHGEYSSFQSVTKKLNIGRTCVIY